MDGNEKISVVFVIKKTPHTFPLNKNISKRTPYGVDQGSAKIPVLVKKE